MMDSPEPYDIYIILWGNNEWELFSGKLEGAIKQAQDNYWNYGHKSARIVPYKSLYFVQDEMVDSTTDNMTERDILLQILKELRSKQEPNWMVSRDQIDKILKS